MYRNPKYTKEKLEIKISAREMKNAFDCLIRMLVMTLERISRIEDMSIENSNTEKQKAKIKNST